MRVRTQEHVRNEGSRRFKSAPLHHPVSKFSDISENRSKSARVRALAAKQNRSVDEPRVQAPNRAVSAHGAEQ